MTTYIDTYISGPDRDALETFARGFTAHIPAQAGRAFVPAGMDAEGNLTPETPEVGDPALFYTCIRSTFDVSRFISAPMTVADDTTGKDVVGVFA